MRDISQAGIYHAFPSALIYESIDNTNSELWKKASVYPRLIYICGNKAKWIINVSVIY